MPKKGTEGMEGTDVNGQLETQCRRVTGVNGGWYYLAGNQGYG